MKHEHGSEQGELLTGRKLAELVGPDPHQPSLLRFLVFETLEWTGYALALFMVYTLLKGVFQTLLHIVLAAYYILSALAEALFEVLSDMSATIVFFYF